MTIIDAYTHFYPKLYLSRIQSLPSERARMAASHWSSVAVRSPHYVDVSSRIGELDKYHIDYEITAISQDVDPNRIGPLGKENELELCRFLNDQMYQVMHESKGRIFSLGTVPFSSIDDGEGIEEMRRAVGLGLKGFMVISNINGIPIDKYERFWAEAEKLDVAVYIHPIDPISTDSRPYEDDYDLMHVFGWPFETTLILSRLIFSGTLQRYPRLKILAHHLGGMIPFFAGRINESYSKTMGLVKPEQKVAGLEEDARAIEPYKKFYYDTAIGGSTSAIRCGCDVFGIDKIVFGTDYPFGPEAGRLRLDTYPSKVRALGLSPEENEKIFESNARRLLKI
ncbi:MAG: amidohydrolase family protein [Nitrososphaerales archaeon]